MSAASFAQAVKVRQTQLSPLYSMFQTYKNPFIASRGSMQYMYDQNNVSSNLFLSSTGL